MLSYSGPSTGVHVTSITLVAVGFVSPWTRPSGLVNQTVLTASASFPVRFQSLEPRLPACACTRADTVNGCYKRAQVRVATPGPAPAAGARPSAPVGSLPRALAPSPAVRPPARSSSRVAHAPAGTRVGPRGCQRPPGRACGRARWPSIRPGRAPRSSMVPPACRMRSRSATEHSPGA